MDEKKKRERSQNFTNEDISILMQCVLTEIKVVENKCTDGVTWKEKRNAWQRITDTFNSQALQRRDINTLKLKYENIKRNLKKKISNEKLHVVATGGGKCSDIKLLWYEEQLYSVLQVGIDGLPSQDDCDVLIENNTTNSVEEIITQAEDSEYQHEEDTPVIIPQEDMRPAESTSTPQNLWKTLKRKRKSVPLTLKEQKEKATHSFEDLAKVKTEVSTLQKNIFERELIYKESAHQQIDKESAIKLKILQKEWEIKEALLEDLRAEKIRKENMFKLMQEEQNLKIEILKCELHCKLKNNIN